MRWHDVLPSIPDVEEQGQILLYSMRNGESRVAASREIYVTPSRMN